MVDPKSSYAQVKRCLKLVNKEFEERRLSMRSRTADEQNIIGNFLTSTQIEIEKSIKSVLDACAIDCGIVDTHED